MPAHRSRKLSFLLAGLAIALVGLAGYAFINAASWLAEPARQPVPSDAAFVLGGDAGDRVLRAAELHREGYARTLVLTGAEDMLGEVLPAYLHWRAAVLVRAGAPEEALLLDSASSNSAEEAAYGLRLARERGWKRVIVVSDPPHMRRLRLLWGRAFAGSGIEVVLVASRPRWWVPGRWWGSRKSAQFVVQEYIKLLYALP